MSVTTIAIPSIFLPHIHISEKKEYVRHILEEKYKLGVISKIECIPKVHKVDGHKYYSCYVFFESWGTGEHALYVLPRLLRNEQTRIIYSGDKYWVLNMNRSYIAFYKNPVHMDLITYLHTDFTMETVSSIMDGLDLGKIHSVEFIKSSDQNYFGENVVWNKANKDIWGRKVPYTYNSTIVRFQYWYRSDSAYAFQNELIQNGYVDIPVSDGITWTFYRETPLLDGINPNVWNKKSEAKHTYFYGNSPVCPSVCTDV